MNLKNHPPIFVDCPAAKQIERLSKAALIDVVVDSCKRLYGEDVWKSNADACLNDLCGPVLSHREDNNPWNFAPGSASLGSQVDREPCWKIKKGTK